MGNTHQKITCIVFFREDTCSFFKATIISELMLRLQYEDASKGALKAAYQLSVCVYIYIYIYIDR
jgi:hypothetical protein